MYRRTAASGYEGLVDVTLYVVYWKRRVVFLAVLFLFSLSNAVVSTIGIFFLFCRCFRL